MELRKRSAVAKTGSVIGRYPRVAGKTPKVTDESAAEKAGGILTHKIPKIAKESAAEKAGNITGKAHATAGASTTAVERAGDIIAKSMGKWPTEARRISHKETISTRMIPGLIGKTVKRIPLANVEAMSRHPPKFMRWRE